MIGIVESIDNNENDIVEEASTTTPKKQKLRSAVWNDFDKIVNADGSTSAKCRQCKRSFTAGGKSGTTHLRKHAESYCPCKKFKSIVPVPLQMTSDALLLDKDQVASSPEFDQKQVAQPSPTTPQEASEVPTKNQDKLGSFVQFYQQQMADSQQFQLQQMAEFQQFQQKQMAAFMQFYQQQMCAFQQFQQQQDLAGQAAAFDNGKQDEVLNPSSHLKRVNNKYG